MGTLSLFLSLSHYLYLFLSLSFYFYTSLSIPLSVILYSGCTLYYYTSFYSQAVLYNTPYLATIRLYSMIHPVPLSHSVALSFCLSQSASLSLSLCIFLSLTLSLLLFSLPHSFSPSVSFLSHSVPL